MDLTPYLIAWRTTGLRDREVVDGLVHPEHAGPSPELTRALAAWPGRYYWSDEPGGRHLVLTRPGERTRDNWLLHALLLLATLATTTYAGAVIAGALSMPGSIGLLVQISGFDAELARSLYKGLVFSVPLMLILLCHELGHYVTARRYLLDVSLPYFIPVPWWPSFIGTMGAFIRLRTIVSDRRQLFDIGVAGPIAGFVVALPMLWFGLKLSAPATPVAEFHGMIVWMGGEYVRVGDSLVTLVVRHLATGDAPGLTLHPLAFAGWVGMFVTMLNLLPIAQLDGGHLFFAALPRWHRAAALVTWISLVLLGRLWIGWWVWATIVLLLSRGQFTHPPVLDAYRPLPRSRRWAAWGALVLFVLTFTPVPMPIHP